MSIIMEPGKNVQLSLPEPLVTQMQEAANADHISLDELAAKALQNHLGRRTLQRFSREAEKRRGSMTDKQVESHVDQVIHEFRDEQKRGR